MTQKNPLFLRFINKEIIVTDLLGLYSKSDDPFTAKYRLHQAKYRSEVLKEAQGYGPTRKSKTVYGNYLLNGEVTGSNFISPIAFSYAKERVQDKKTNKALTIDAYRLFNNMLSSMPMCFTCLRIYVIS